MSQDSVELITKTTLTQKCPHCGQASLFKSKWSLETVDSCPSCAFPWEKHDSGDGPAVFLSFILGFSVIPLALIVNAWLSWPLWLHTIVWSIVIIALSVGLLKPSKAATIALQYLHCPDKDWQKDER